jgi:hypothetical protein
LRPALPALVLLLAGCAVGAAGVECHGTSWYRQGLDDGRAGLAGEAERYRLSCGAAFDAAVYEEGFRAGKGR